MTKLYNNHQEHVSLAEEIFEQEIEIEEISDFSYKSDEEESTTSEREYAYQNVDRATSSPCIQPYIVVSRSSSVISHRSDGEESTTSESVEYAYQNVDWTAAPYIQPYIVVSPSSSVTSHNSCNFSFNSSINGSDSSTSESSFDSTPRRNRGFEGRFEDEVWPKDADEEDIKEVMLEQERDCMPKQNMIAIQPEITWEMRKKVILWITEVHDYLGNLSQETLYLSVNILDQYLSMVFVQRMELQLVAITSFWIACKYRENRKNVPSVEHFFSLCGRGYPLEYFIQMERHICIGVSWKFWSPTAEGFLKVESSTFLISDKILAVARFLMEHSLLSEIFISRLPSLIAESSIYLAKILMREPVIEVSNEVEECVHDLHDFLKRNSIDIIRHKYSELFDVFNLSNILSNI
ncbi:hypothetical protein G9A89_005361 [Geosiphon pyriformis]|nr:hypothetical protein G9A89_005361 [Geosiphon pyriformis]